MMQRVEGSNSCAGTRVANGVRETLNSEAGESQEGFSSGSGGGGWGIWHEEVMMQCLLGNSWGMWAAWRAVRGSRVEAERSLDLVSLA